MRGVTMKIYTYSVDDYVTPLQDLQSWFSSDWSRILRANQAHVTKQFGNRRQMLTRQYVYCPHTHADVFFVFFNHFNLKLSVCVATKIKTLRNKEEPRTILSSLNTRSVSLDRAS